MTVIGTPYRICSDIARVCGTTDGVWDACGAEAEGPWDGYGLCAHVIA